MLLKVNGHRLWQSLMAMAEIGATSAGGNTRLALTELDKQGRELFIRWCHELAMSIHFDAIGNLFARYSGTDDGMPVVIGSHLDTQPKGGRFDGIFGVLAGLEVVRTLHEQNIRLSSPIELVAWTNEEGARFTPAMLGSAVFTGVIPLDSALQIVDKQGISVEQSLKEIGHQGDYALQRPFAAYYEAHIEQGPVLEAANIPIGVVTGGQGICWLDIQVKGVAGHAGTTPMPMRKDAMFAAAEMLSVIRKRISDDFPRGLMTVGEFQVPHASRNTIPAEVSFTVDLRHPDDARLEAMKEAVTRWITDIADSCKVNAIIRLHWLSPSVAFDKACVNRVRQAVNRLRYPSLDIISGAGHDAINIAKHCPTTMIFIPCAEGISHNEREWASPEDVAQGADVLLHTILQHLHA